MLTVQLDGPTDWTGFRLALRHLIGEGIKPSDVRWQTGAIEHQGGLFDADTGAMIHPHVLPTPPAMNLPKGAVDMAADAFLHADPARFTAIHTCLARVAADRRHWHDTLAPERVAMERFVKQVRREKHKMKAFVRFHPVADALGNERYLAWFEPDHYIVDAVAPFFAKRFAGMRWAIFTPKGCVEWDGTALCHAPGCASPPFALDTTDSGEWLAYYESTFNPARANPDQMRREMPVRYWKNLPEARSIPRLLNEAQARTTTMTEAPGEARERRAGHLPGRPTRQISPDDARATLERAVRNCQDCPIGAAATQAVCGEGPLDAPVMIVGEQPGDREDLIGRPFVGPAGSLLRDSLQHQPWAQHTYLTNAVKHFKYEMRGKRRLHKTPGQREAAACSQWLDHEIALVQPRCIVALGATAARSVLGQSVRIHTTEGQWLARPDGTPVLVLTHPSALLRMAPEQRERVEPAWRVAFDQVRHVLDNAAASDHA
ncbi:UdgX family uracil-DNA binding protein [Nitrogeniibacter aestuarii]|uniref:UdgX family uracil-DNA binding protein n=1 Tax=Nitrogeniibacter aestuarii TaxID=2815343 RepID=UPI001D0FDBCB|nr:UdgX family uracil-DNA binding protein [Nitrogeniibacter aestuarii]